MIWNRIKEIKTQSERKRLLFIAGCISILMSIFVLFHSVGSYSYGSGIDAKYLYEIASITKLGLGAILLVGGLVLIAFALPDETQKTEAGAKSGAGDTPKSVAAKVCSECGKPLPDKVRACPNCGCPVSVG